MDREKEHAIDQLFTLWQEGICPGGQVVVRQHGAILYDKCFGYADIENVRPITGDTVFHVASVSKQLTVLAVLLLVEQGRVKLDEDIRVYLPDLVRFYETVTVRNLMNNNSGIRDIWTLEMLRGTRIDDTITQEDAIHIISRQTGLNFAPGSKYMYSNSNFVYLAEIAERVSGQSLNSFLKERVFGPLGMSHTCIRDRYWQRINGRATSFYDNGTEYYHNVLNYGSYGSTSLHTTVYDFLKWMDQYKAPTICKPETIQIMKTAPVLTDGSQSIYAAGLMVGERQGHKYFQHGGADAAFRTNMARIEQDDLDIVVFSNTQNTPPGLASMAIADIVLGLEPSKPVQTEVGPSLTAQEAVGFYYSDAVTNEIAFSVTQQGGGLWISDSFEPAPLTWIEGNCYRQGRLGTRYYLGDHPSMTMGNDKIELKRHEGAARPSEFLMQFEGVFQCDEIDTRYEIYEQDGLLWIEHFRHGKQRLYQTGHDRFMMEEPTAVLRFTRGSGGIVIGLTMSCDRVQNLPFSREL